MANHSPSSEFKIQRLTTPVTARHRHEMKIVETIITHAYDAETLFVKNGRITRGQPLNLEGVTTIDLNTNDMNIATPTFTGSTIESVLKQYEKKFPSGIKEKTGAGGAARFFIGRFKEGSILIANKGELQTRLENPSGTPTIPA